MTAVATDTRLEAGQLSCFTANLSGYLTGRQADPLSRIARSVRLAIRVDLPDDLVAFSHHGTPLCDLGDGRRLRYRGTATATEVPQRLQHELSAEDDLLVVTYAGTMAWSPADAHDQAPHFVLVTGRRGDRWRVLDEFSALLPAGRQRPFHGWVSTADLTGAMTPRTDLDAVHLQRLRHAFGTAVPVPPERYQWLSPARDDPRPLPSAPAWRTDSELVLVWLTEFFAQLESRATFIDDMWAAAQHHTFRYRHLIRHRPLRPAEHELVTSAVRAWTDLPMALRFAADSAARGRPRPALVRTTFDHLRTAERRCADLLASHGYSNGRDV